MMCLGGEFAMYCFASLRQFLTLSVNLSDSCLGLTLASDAGGSTEFAHEEVSPINLANVSNTIQTTNSSFHFLVSAGSPFVEAFIRQCRYIHP